MPLLAGIDLGSTSLKAVIYDLDGRALAQIARARQLVPPGQQGRAKQAQPDSAQRGK